MSAAAIPEIIIYTGVKKSVNESTLDPSLETNSTRRLYNQNRAPINPLRRFIFTTDDFNISGNSNNTFLFSNFIRLLETEILPGPRKSFTTINNTDHGKIDITLLGSGGNGTAFKLNFTKYNKVYILKRMVDTDSEVKRQNRREIKILFYLKEALKQNAWCVVNLYAAALTRNTAFLLYEYIEGRDLFRIAETEFKTPLVNNNSKFKLTKLIEIQNNSSVEKKRIVIFKNNTSDHYKERIKQIADRLIEALAYIHSVGIIHNDIKPDNIIIPDNLNILPFFIDFGFAAFRDEGMVYNRFGTPAYLSIHRTINSKPENKNNPKNKHKSNIRISNTDADLHAIEKTFLFCGVIDDDKDKNGVNIDFKEYKQMYMYYLDKIRKENNNHKGNNNHKENNTTEPNTLNTIRIQANAVAMSNEKKAAHQILQELYKKQQAVYEKKQEDYKIQQAAFEQQQAEYARQQAEYDRQREQYGYSKQSGKDSGYNRGSRGGRRKTKNKRQRKTRKQTSN
jgi:tRNA A-37 threonylcarbamoyl transferase component Bud32